MVCAAPPRRLKDAFSPVRVAAVLLAVAAVVVGMQGKSLPSALVVLLGIAVGVLVFLFPAIQQVEFGFPSGVKVATALRNREEELRQAFESSRADMELCAQLLCDDPGLASRLLEASWAKTVSTWRGPVTPELRSYILCLFVRLLTSHTRWAGRRAEPPVTSGTGSGAPLPLAGLALRPRIVVVLHEFADMPLAQIAKLTDRPVAEVRHDMLAAQRYLDRLDAEGTTP